MIRVLLDENIPRKLKWALEAETLTVPERGWGGIKNGRLLRLAAAEFDVLLTMDRGMEHQQNLSGVDLCLIVLSAVSNDIDDLLPLAPSINAALRGHPRASCSEWPSDLSPREHPLAAPAGPDRQRGGPRFSTSRGGPIPDPRRRF